MELSLNKDWELSCRPLFPDPEIPENLNVISADLPDDVILSLMKHGIVNDPVVRRNFLECKWIGKCEWRYRRSFIPETEAGRTFLVFSGLAGKAAVFLNGKELAVHNSMHRELRLEITGLIEAGKAAELEVRLRPFDGDSLRVPVISWFSQWSGGVYDAAFCEKRSAVRKPDYSYGWDWTQGLPICGIEGGVRLESYGFAVIRNLILHPENSGRLLCNFDLETALAEMVSAEAVLRILKKGETAAVLEKKETLIAGPGVIEYELSAVVPDPKLWFPAGYGEQNLYELELEIRKEGASPVSVKKTFAFRSVRIHEQRFTERQGEFRLLINGIPVFAHGANWIPPDIIPARVTEKRIRRLLELAALGGINYLRFWGGGYCENELFYDLCDRYGILIWQDFMFSGPEIPEFDPVFREECRKEAREVIARLSHHPSIAVWCGSNETDDYHCANGTQHRSTFRPETHYYGWRLLHKDFPRIFAEILPEAVYIPSCGFIGNAAPESAKINDHGFGTSHKSHAGQFCSDREFDEFSAVPAFWNEVYGVSPDEESSWSRYLAAQDVDRITNPVLTDHSVLECQRNDEMLRFFDQYSFDAPEFRYEYDVRKLFRFYAKAHCEVVLRNMQFLRRNMQFAGGVAFWMFNSAFTMHGWGMVDYYGSPKPVFYAMARMCKAALAIPAVYDKRIEIHLSGFFADTRDIPVKWCVSRFDGTELFRCSELVRGFSGGSRKIAEIPLEQIKNFEPESCFVAAFADGVPCTRFFVPERTRKLPDADVELRRISPAEIELFSRGFAANVSLFPCTENCYPEDNWFDLLPGERKRIRFRGETPENISVDWENRNRGLSIINSVQKGNLWEVEFFNPGESVQTAELSVEAAELFPIAGRAISLNPGEVCTLTLPVQPRLIPACPFFSKAVLKWNGKTLTSAVRFPEQLYFRNGIFEFTNRTGLPLQLPSLKYTAEQTDGSLHEKVSPAETLAPDQTFRFDFSPPDSIYPFRNGLVAGETAHRFFLDPSVTLTEEMLELLPVKPADAKSSTCQTADFPVPDLLSGNGVLFEAEPGKTVRMFFHRYQDVLIFTAFLHRIPFRQTQTNEAVFLESHLMLILESADHSFYRDYSLAQTRFGNEVFLRRGSSGLLKGRREFVDSTLEIHYFPESEISAWRFSLDLRKAGAEDFFRNGTFLVSGSVCWEGHSCFIPGTTARIRIPVSLK